MSISQGGGDDDAACSPSPEALLAAMAEHEEPREVFIDAEALADDATTPAEGERPDDDSVLVLNNDQNGLSDATGLPGEDVDADAERALLTASRESSIGRAIDDVLDDELQFSGEDLDDSDDESGDDGDEAPPYAHSEFSPRLADFEDDDDDFLGDEEHDRLDARSEFRSVGVGASVSDVFANDEDDSWLTYDPTSSPPPEHDLNLTDVPEWGGPTSPIADPNRRTRPRRRGANRREEDRAVHASSFDGGVLDEDRGDDPSLPDDRSPDDRSRRHPRRHSRRRDRTLRFSGEALAGVQVQVEVANVEVDERACGEDSDEEAEAVVAAVRRWQDPWRRHRDASLPAVPTYSTTQAHPLHPIAGVTDPSVFGDFENDGEGGSSRGDAATGMWRAMWRRDDPVEETVGVDTTNPYDTYADAADGNYPGDESGVATLTLEDSGGADQIDGSNQTPAVVDADIRDAARAIEEARLVLDRELSANGPGGYDEAMDDAIDAAFARAEETLARTEETAAALSPGSQPPPPGKDKEREGDARAGVDVRSDSAFDGGAGGAGSAAVFRSRSLESSLPPAPASDLSSAAASGGASGGTPLLARRSSKKRIEIPPGSSAATAERSRSRLHSPATKSRPTSREAATRFESPVRDRGWNGDAGGRGGARTWGPSSGAASAFATAFGGGFEETSGGVSGRGVADLVMSRESRLVSALRGEIRCAREERMELEARCQGLQLRSSAAEWERDGLRRSVDALERSLEQHRRALRREVTTRVKVGLDYGDFRGGTRAAGGGVGGSEQTQHASLFPQEVLQAVVRGAVDQSVECALGTGHGGVGGSVVDRGTGGDENTHDADAPFPRSSFGANSIEARGVEPAVGAVDDDLDSLARHPPASPRMRYPAPFVPASSHQAASSDPDADDATRVSDAGVLEDASHLYSMVRDALRVQT